MKEFSQICERFLADTRQHFLASDETAGRLQSAAAQINLDQGHASAGTSHLGQTGL